MNLYIVQSDALMIEFAVPNFIPSIGEMITVNCSVEVTPGVTDLPLLTLTHPNGTNISSVYKKKMYFTIDPVQARDAGQYICSAELVLSDLGGNLIVVQSKKNISLKCKFIKIHVMKQLNLFFLIPVPTPKVSITNSDLLIAGYNNTLICTVDNYAVSDLIITVNITWSKSGSVLSNDHQRVDITGTSGSETVFISQLRFSPLSSFDDNITCSATAFLVESRPFIDATSTETRYNVYLNIEGIQTSS